MDLEEVLNVSKTPTPSLARPSKSGALNLLRAVLISEIGNAVGRSLLLY